MYTDTITQPPGLRVRPIDYDEARERLLDCLGSREFWVIVFDRSGIPIVEEISRRHYQDRPPEDHYYALFPVPSGAGMVGVAVFRRSLMLAPKFRFILSKHDVNLSAQEIVHGWAICSAWLQNRGHVLDLCRDLGLKDPEGLAMES